MPKEILHVCNLDKFIPPFISFVEENFGLDNHLFWLIGDHGRYPVKQTESAYKVGRSQFGELRGLLRLVHLIRTSDKVILHGLFNLKVIIVLFMMPWALRKCYWVIWGGDLYCYKLGEKNWKWKIKEFFRSPVIKRMGNIVCYTEGEYDLAVDWYKTDANYHSCFVYTSNMFHKTSANNHESCSVPKNDGGIRILVGNSADPSNNHKEIFDKLEKYKNQKIKVACPLNYGNKVYAEEVIKYGYDLFSDKFEPIVDYLPFDQYMEFLETIDIAIFNHKRQQAMGNIRSLLGKGKKVYMRKELTSAKKLMSDGIRIFDINMLSIDKNFPERERNIKKVKAIFSKEELVAGLNRIWND